MSGPLEEQPFLTRDVPQLQANQGVFIPVYDFECKVYADRRSVVIREELVHVSLDEGGLACRQFANNQDLEEVLA